MNDARATRVIVAVCTYYRNADLTNLLSKIHEYSQSGDWRSVDIGITVVDDSPDGHGRTVATQFDDAFPLGLIYKNSASRNISVARNHALENSLHRGEWIAMTDDDCEPSEQWLAELVRVQAMTGADVVTGIMQRRAPEHAPRWIKAQPFLELGEFDAADGDEMPVAYTNDSLISSAFLLANPELRFDPELGRLGGEDVTFFRAMKSKGALIVFAKHAFVYENEPDERLTLRYQLRRYFWHGNSSVVTSLHAGETRTRLAIHSAASLVRAVAYPAKRLLMLRKPHVLFSIALLCEGLGKFAGVAGIKVNHS